MLDLPGLNHRPGEQGHGIARPLRFHLASLPHTNVSKEFVACAYTMKIYNFAKMMRSLGHHVTLYAPEGSDTSICDEFVQIISRDEQRQLFGEHDWKTKGFKLDWNESQPYWQMTNLRTAAEIRVRAKKADMVCIVGGSCQKQISDNMDRTLVAVVEPFIGYRGVFAEYQVYESHTHLTMNATRGVSHQDPNGNNYHDVVPVYFDPDDFPEGKGDGGYYLYMGRLITRKGITVAENAVRALGGKLLIAGQGVKIWDPNEKLLVTDEGQFSQTFQGDHIEYVGFADVKRRAELMGGAIACFTPTLYFEPGGNTSVEPQACGTPVLASHFGCFTQQVKQGVTGFRCRTLDQWVWAAKEAAKLDRKKIREHAIATHSLDVVRWQFDEYFQSVYDRYMGAGWAQLHPERTGFPCFA